MSTKETLIQEDGFGIVPISVEDRKEGNPFQIIRRYTLTNKNNASLRLISWGAGIQSIKVPNKQNILGDIVLGFDSIDGYLRNRNIGRITNRLSDKINEKTCSLFSDTKDPSDDFGAVDNVNWESYVLDKQVVRKRYSDYSNKSVQIMTHKKIMSHLGQSRSDENPVDILSQVKYSWTDENELKINIRATATAPTFVNITSYCPMNLAGHGMGSEELNNHVVTMNADNWTSDIQKGMPTIRTVECTVFDLRNPTRLKNRLNRVPGGGFNHNLRINSPSIWCYRFCGRILHPASGRFLEVYSDQPSVQFYTGNDLPDPELKYLPDLEDYMWGGCGDVLSEIPSMGEESTKQNLEIRGKDGISYKRHGAFVLSPQNLPPCSLCPGKVFSQNMTYKFGVKNN